MKGGKGGERERGRERRRDRGGKWRERKTEKGIGCEGKRQGNRYRETGREGWSKIDEREGGREGGRWREREITEIQ